MREDKEFLKELLTAPSPSGQEEKALEIWDKFMASFSGKYYSDKIGNSAWSIGRGDIKILLSGHIDQVNARVSLIHDNGLLAIHYTGGIDNRSLPGSKVDILLDSGKIIRGRVIKRAMHNDKPSSWPEDHYDFKQIRVDIGAESKEEVENLGIHPGNLVCYSPEVNLEFGKNRICSTSLDDKVAVYIVARVMKKLAKSIVSEDPAWAKKYQVIGLAATQEETGLRGATIASKNISPNISIDIDVTFATDDEMTENKEELGDIKLGKGPVLSYGADKSRKLNMALSEIAKTLGTEYQTESTRAGGTNTDAIQLNSPDCETTHIAIPNRSMHSQCEVCDWRDIDACIELLCQAIISEKL